MTQDPKNLILAIGLSLLVIIGWQYFYASPQLEKQRQAQSQLQQPAAKPPAGATMPTPNAAAPGPVPGAAPPPNAGIQPTSPEAIRTRAQALAESPRIAVDTKSLSGSIALKGGRIDDVVLKGYRETVDPGSPNIVLLSPSGAPEPYYAEWGFVPQPGQRIELPKNDTLWSADLNRLTAEKPVNLTYDNGAGLIFHRTIAVDDDYMFTVTQSVENKGTEPVTVYPYELVSRHGKPVVAGYAVLHEGFVGVVGDSGVKETSYDGIEKEAQATQRLDGTGGWLGFTDKYWATAVIPDQNTPIKGRFLSYGTGSKIYQADQQGEAKTIEPGATLAVSSRLFAGAKVSDLLDRYESGLGIKKFDLLIDWGWFYFITRPMFKLIDFFYRLIGNFGLAILCVTLLVKIAFFPLANRSYMSMARMKAMQPQMKALQERYKDDRAKQQQELMALYKREKINPVAGCLPVIIQIPVFFSLYKVLFVTIEMRQAPFFGWIRDLSQPDPTNIFTLFGLIPWNPTHLPLIGSFLWLGIWPLIMGFSMFIQMKMNPEPTDPVQKQMFAYMPVIFTFMLGSFPAGLVIYWTWNNLLSVAQQGFIMRRAGVKFELWDNLASVFRRKPGVSAGE
ncbi:MAG: YidC/Oxa1 family rane protein insertase [Methylobacteriaceae bacterium]|nr:YidC/Oxa1 family rane protein insertase [Methylobacteriaceae bacterium]